MNNVTRNGNAPRKRWLIYLDARGEACVAEFASWGTNEVALQEWWAEWRDTGARPVYITETKPTRVYPTKPQPVYTTQPF